MDSSPVYAPDRALIATDLDRIASSVSPLIVSLLASYLEEAAAQIESEPMMIGVGPLKANVAPLVAKMVRTQGSARLPASVTPQLSAALRTLLDLTDEDLSRLCEVTAYELGAWVGELDPLTPEELAAAGRPLVARLSP